MNQADAQLIEKVKAYRIPQAAIEMLNEHRPLVLAGPTAAGKETLVQAIQESGKGAKVVTHTTRDPREGEQNGVDYWYVSDARIAELIAEEAFIEVKNVHHFIYGSSMAAYQTIVDQGQKPILVIDVQGVEDIRRHVPALEPIFILPPNFETWIERLDKRGRMSHTEKLKRFESARDELDRALKDEHFTLIVNHDLTQASKQIIDGISDPATQHANRELAQKLIHNIDAFQF